MRLIRNVAVLFAAQLLGTGAMALAQSELPGPGQPSGQSAPGAQQSAPDSTGAPDTSVQAPVLHITSVEVIRSAHAPFIDIGRVRGLTSTAGWQEAELVPLTRSVPADGMLEMVFVARAPGDAVEATGFETVEAIFPLEPGHPFRGINVHGASGSLSVTVLPGYAERRQSFDDCSRCVGKIFVPKGAAAPAGKSASQVVREEQLPPGTRVIRPTDGIPSADSNPNRLTLVLSSEGKIRTAIWD